MNSAASSARDSETQNEPAGVLLDEPRDALSRAEVIQSSALIHQLPTELLLRIFTLYVEDQHEFIQLRRIAEPARKVDEAAPFTVSAVCRRWKAVAFSSTRLWARPVVYIHSNQQVALQEQLLTQWVERSGDLPIDISILFYQLVTWDVHDSFKIILTVAPRLARLNLRAPPRLTSRLLKSLDGAPRLQGLQVSIADTHAGQQFHYRPPEVSLPQLPALKDLRIQNAVKWENSAVDFPRLVVCHLEMAFGPYIREVLERAPVLQQLTVFLHNAFEVPPAPPTRHSYLKELTIEGVVGSTNMYLVLGHLLLPSLERLSFDSNGFAMSSNIGAVKPLIQRSQCSLKILNLGLPSCQTSAEEMVQLVESLPSLKHLSLGSRAYSSGRYKWITDEYFSRIIPELDVLCSREDSFLRQLDSLDLNVVVLGNPAFSWEGFSNFLKAFNSALMRSQEYDGSGISKDNPLSCRLHINLKLSYGEGLPAQLLVHGIDPELLDPHWSKYISLKVLKHSILHYSARIRP
ncbi:hypothetical protein CVT26_015382 [Gymnopilus dilepis]|uniref:F-box domain-containing protein n=1 Tax=Gymnopilus dilepis TaxID=231916 RepID=A0A409WA85_9AGAR|nr:hypothetical protein CVT26_015382 [Gymnopilus dilepis]